MTDRTTEFSFTGTRDFVIEDIPHVDTAKLDPIETAAIERTIIDREILVQNLNVDLLEIKSQNTALESHLSRLETERNRLQDRIHELEQQRPTLEPNAVFAGIGSALGQVEADLDDIPYRVGDVDFTLKANVINTDEGLRVHLPSVTETSAAANLSEISFRFHAAQPVEEVSERALIDIPDVVGLSSDEATHRLARRGFEVGDVELIENSDAPSGTVLAQFPEPDAIAAPGSAVDLAVADESPSEPEPVDDADRESTLESHLEVAVGDVVEFDFAVRNVGSEPIGLTFSTGRIADVVVIDAETESPIWRWSDDRMFTQVVQRRVLGPDDTIEQAFTWTEPEPGTYVAEARLDADVQITDRTSFTVESTPRLSLDEIESFIEDRFERSDVDLGTDVIERLRTAGIDDTAALADHEPGELARILDISIEDETERHQRDDDEIELQRIDGIGPTYASRLIDAGIEDVGDLVTLDVNRISSITRASVRRVEGWLDQAESMVDRR